MSVRLASAVLGTTAFTFRVYWNIFVESNNLVTRVASPILATAASLCYVGYTFSMPNMLSSLEPTRVYWILWSYGTAITAAISYVNLLIDNEKVYPYGKVGVACHMIFSIAIGYLYTDLFNQYMSASLAAKSQKDNLLPTKDENTLKDFAANLRTTPLEKLEKLITETPLLRLAGNEMVKTLASHLPSLDGHYNIKFEKSATIPAQQEGEIVHFDQFSKDHLQHLSQYLSIYDLSYSPGHAKECTMPYAVKKESIYGEVKKSAPLPLSAA